MAKRAFAEKKILRENINISLFVYCLNFRYLKRYFSSRHLNKKTRSKPEKVAKAGIKEASSKKIIEFKPTHIFPETFMIKRTLRPVRRSTVIVFLYTYHSRRIATASVVANSPPQSNI